MRAAPRRAEHCRRLPGGAPGCGTGRRGAPIVKADRRYRPARQHQAVETEALTQGVVVGLVRAALDELLPQPLTDVQEREAEQRQRLAEILAQLGGH
jgi:hypothetical protein